MDVIVLEPVEAGCVQQVDDVLAVSGRVLELGLEVVAEQQDEVRVMDLLDVAGRRLEIVRLGPGGVRLRMRTEAPPISSAANARG